jgi:hypothetical protein
MPTPRARLMPRSSWQALLDDPPATEASLSFRFRGLGNRDRVVVAAIIVVVFVLLGSIGVALYHRRTFHEWPGANLPDRLDHCDRAYGRGDTVNVKAAPRLAFYYSFSPWLAAHHEIYSEPSDRFTNDLGEQCPMVLWAHDGDTYVEYSLEGGP